MRISDWSSDVCSSDLATNSAGDDGTAGNDDISTDFGNDNVAGDALAIGRDAEAKAINRAGDDGTAGNDTIDSGNGADEVGGDAAAFGGGRSEARRVGQECVSTGRYRWSP